jgi:hypothetical protein
VSRGFRVSKIRDGSGRTGFAGVVETLKLGSFETWVLSGLRPPLNSDKSLQLKNS